MRLKHRVRTPILAAALTLSLTAGGAAAWALDRFVIEDVKIADVAAYEAAQAPSAAESTAPDDAATVTAAGTTTAGGGVVVTDTTYKSADASITITEHTTADGSATWFVADVVLSDATGLRSAFANNQFGQNIIADTSDIAAANNAILAINGDYYGFRDTGIVIRNGVVYRDEGARQGLAFYTDGTVALYDETATSAAELLADGVWNTLSFGPGIVEDGQVVDGIDTVEVDTNFGNHSIQGLQPRTGIGVVDENHLVLVVADGRSSTSQGVTMTEFAQIFVDLGATTAYNLDGGGSSTMWFNGEVVNGPSEGHERGVSDILYVAASS